MSQRYSILRKPLIEGAKSLGDVTADVARPLEAGPTRLWWWAFLISFSVLTLGALAVAYQIKTGIGTWGLNRTVGWGFDITNFVFWVGIGHAGTLISAILFLFRQRWRTSINRSAEAMTLFAVMCAGLFPLIHMGRPWLFFWIAPSKGTDRFSKVGPQWLQSNLTVQEGQTVGENGYIYARRQGSQLAYVNLVTLVPTGQKSSLAVTQTHHTVSVPEALGGTRRYMVRETTLPAYLEDPASGNHFEHEVLQLWDQDHQYTGHHWGMAIDLSRCTGCSACVVSCQAENNIPVVGSSRARSPAASPRRWPADWESSRAIY